MLPQPDFFITMTCNPNWPEIVNNLKPGTKAEDRHDLNARVFRGYLDGMLTDLLKNGYMGRRIANTHVIEFQKRGLPHAHILVMLHPDDKPQCGEDLNDYVCAELPPQDGPLRRAVLQHMLHSECGPGSGQPCMDDDDKYCKKNFPKEFAAETVWDESSGLRRLEAACISNQRFVAQGQAAAGTAHISVCDPVLTGKGQGQSIAMKPRDSCDTVG